MGQADGETFIQGLRNYEKAKTVDMMNNGTNIRYQYSVKEINTPETNERAIA